MSLESKTVTQSGISAKEKDVHDGTKSSLMEGVIVPEVTFKIMDDYVQPPKLASRPLSYYRYVEKTPEELYDQIEYDMDEEVNNQVLYSYCLKQLIFHDVMGGRGRTVMDNIIVVNCRLC